MNRWSFTVVLLLVAAIALSGAACETEPDASNEGPGGSGGSVPPPDVELDPPAAGFQLGTPAFEVAQGEEVQDCYFFRVPGDPAGAAKWVNRITLRQNSGTHHGNIFRVRTILGLAGEHGDVVSGGECWKSGNWADWPLVINSQESSTGEDVDWTMPDGVALRFQPGELLMLQTHYVNATTQATPSRGKVLVNFHEVPEAAVEHELGTLFATNQNILVCPGDQGREYSASCNFARGQSVTVVAANGHFHSRGRTFTMAPYDSLSGESGEIFYTSNTWDDPPMARDLAVTIPADGGIYYTCSYDVPADACGDETKQCCYTFGGKVETQEHCNIFVYYYPKVADAGCF